MKLYHRPDMSVYLGRHLMLAARQESGQESEGSESVQQGGSELQKVWDSISPELAELLDEEAYKTLENQLEDAKKCVTQAASRRYARGTDVVACISQAIAAGALKKTKKAPETCVTVSVAQPTSAASGKTTQCILRSNKTTRFINFTIAINRRKKLKYAAARSAGIVCA